MVAKQTAPRLKHIPQRTCIGCREVLAKRTLIRLVRTSDGLKIDPTGKLSGRGAYLHDRRSCWERGIKGALSHALKCELSGEDRELLMNFMTNFAIEDPQSEKQDLPS